MSSAYAAPQIGPRGNARRVTRYILIRAATLLVTVVAAVYLTILIANFGGQIDEFIKADIDFNVGLSMKGVRGLTTEERAEMAEARRQAAYEAAGLNTPFAVRCLRWLKRGLTLDWGETNMSFTGGWTSRSREIRSIILDSLPRSLLIFGSANLLLFFSTVLVALPLTNKRRSWLDRLIITLSPLSAAPAWVYGIILNLIALTTLGNVFAGSAFDAWPDTFKLAYVPMMMRHLVLPVLAIFLSGLFQGIYTWRTFFQLHAAEDYVELARAKGLPSGMLERRYILRPMLPALLTSFALIFVNLWQEVIILEQVFNVTGIGSVFFKVITFNVPDRTPFIVALVVTFAYLLAITVFVLDLVYTIVDPRIRIENRSQTVPGRVRRPKLQLRLPWKPPRQAPTTKMEAAWTQTDTRSPGGDTVKSGLEALNDVLGDFDVLERRRIVLLLPFASGEDNELLADRVYPDLGIAVRFESTNDPTARIEAEPYRQWGIILVHVAPEKPISPETLRDIRASLSAAARRIAQGSAAHARKCSLMTRIAAAKKACQRALDALNAPPHGQGSYPVVSDRPQRTSSSGSRRGLSLALRQMSRYPTAIVGLVLILVLIGASICTIIAIPYDRMIAQWREGEASWMNNPQDAPPAWINLFRRNKLPRTIALDSRAEDASHKTRSSVSEEMTQISIVFPFDYPYETLPQDLGLFIDTEFDRKRPLVNLTWITPDGQEVEFMSTSVQASTPYRLSRDDGLERKLGGDSPLATLLSGTNRPGSLPMKGAHELRLDAYVFEDDADVDASMVLYGKVHGLAGTDSRRRDLVLPLLWGMPIALAFGLLAAVGTTVSSVLIAAVGTWFGGWIDLLVQRLTEVNMILPFLPVSVMVFVLYSKSFWVILGVTVLLSIFGSSIKSYRALFLQIREAPYVEAALSYGAGNWRIISRYLIPRMVSVLVPQLVIMVPGYVFLEASLAFLGVSDPVLPTWGKLIVEGLSHGLHRNNYHLILGPLSLLMLVGFAFVMFGISLERAAKPD
ncbi:MAG: ABC transporter permease subunit [Anaerolineae bacterium]